ncbi:hypothetical protein OSSY52_20620 [Tepiditoga spiralis]|uniref:Uncharacterized protein n=1 Tax=Tepiditoga spiralis TaxID=2108365 RepID=A0A7G1G661_9BACT|nr:hypothetical protein OSSY52_20620 [Tepiditoga spiralis]
MVGVIFMKKDVFEVIDIFTKEFDVDIIDNTKNKKDTVIKNEKNF